MIPEDLPKSFKLGDWVLIFGRREAIITEEWVDEEEEEEGFPAEWDWYYRCDFLDAKDEDDYEVAVEGEGEEVIKLIEGFTYQSWRQLFYKQPLEKLLQVAIEAEQIAERDESFKEVACAARDEIAYRQSRECLVEAVDYDS